jgi:hypothetical protein
MARSDPPFNLRMPPELKFKVEESSKAKGRSINAELVLRIEESFISSEIQEHRADVKIFNIAKDKKRIVFGKLINSLDLDYTQNLTSLRRDIELSLNALKQSSFLKRLTFFNKDVLVYQGGNHIDIVDNGKQSLGWLTIEDHYVHHDD